MHALLIADLQNDFMPGGALAVREGDLTVPVANRVMERFSSVYAVQDFHPSDHQSFVTEHPGRRVGDVIDLDGVPQVLWPPHCVQGTPGQAFHPDLDTSHIARVFHKGTNPRIDSYSAFFDNAHKQDTGLGSFLKGLGVEEVTVLGLATDYCVRATCLDALSLGFRVNVVPEGCRAVDLEAGDGERTLRELEAAGARLVTEQHAADR